MPFNLTNQSKNNIKSIPNLQYLPCNEQNHNIIVELLSSFYELRKAYPNINLFDILFKYQKKNMLNIVSHEIFKSLYFEGRPVQNLTQLIFILNDCKKPKLFSNLIQEFRQYGLQKTSPNQPIVIDLDAEPDLSIQGNQNFIDLTSADDEPNIKIKTTLTIDDIYSALDSNIATELQFQISDSNASQETPPLLNAQENEPVITQQNIGNKRLREKEADLPAKKTYSSKEQSFQSTFSRLASSLTKKIAPPTQESTDNTFKILCNDMSAHISDAPQNPSPQASTHSLSKNPNNTLPFFQTFHINNTNEIITEFMFKPGS